MTDDARAQRFHDEWESRYQAGQTGWDRGSISPALGQWLDSGELTPCRILLPGCGNGYEAPFLARLGFEVIAVDIASSPIRNLRVALDAEKLSAEVIQADVLTWSPAQPVDAVYEQTCLCALDPSHWQEYEQKLFNWIKPNGKLFAQFMQTYSAGGPPFHCAMEDMRALFLQERWAWRDEAHPRVEHFGGKEEIPLLLVRR